MPPSTLLGRPPERTGEIVRELRGRITRGDLAPGMQLPTRVEIEQHFGASPGTVQRALQELQGDGFVTVNGRQGTFVSKNPPHLTNYALVFPVSPKKDWNRFFQALDQEAPALTQAIGRQITVYYEADSHSDSEDYHRLVSDVEAHRLGGLIFASRPELLLGTPVLEEPHIPRVAIMAPMAQYAMPQINLNRDSLWERGADWLLAQGRRNLALLLLPIQVAEIEAVHTKMLERGFNVPPQWIQGTPRQAPELTRNLIHLLFESGRQRPDAFFITDDNLIEPALAGLRDAGVKVPEDVEVIAHSNFPHAVPVTVPVRRLGFDARQVLQACFDAINAQRANHEVPLVTTIAAQFEEESGDDSILS